LLLGLAGSLLVAFRLAEEDSPRKVMGAFAPWASVSVILWLASMWLMFQPMEMRAMLMGG
jgi:low temperature requirement protein LtrA